MKNSFSCSLVFFSLCAGLSQAASLSVVGVDEVTNDAWRTSGVSKSLDADSDNIYGTDGYFIAQHADGTDISQPLYATVATVGGPGIEAAGAENHQSVFDDVTQTGVGPVADLVAGDYWFNQGGATGTEDAFFTVTLNASASFRLGVITDQTNNNPAGLHWEASRGIRVTGPGGLDTGQIDAVGPGEAWRNGDVDYVLFDISGDPGDVFTVIGVHDDRWNANALGGVFFDTIPEPSTSLLGALGVLGLLLRRRR